MLGVAEREAVGVAESDVWVRAREQQLVRADAIQRIGWEAGSGCLALEVTGVREPVAVDIPAAAVPMPGEAQRRAGGEVLADLLLVAVAVCVGLPGTHRLALEDDGASVRWVRETLTSDGSCLTVPVDGLGGLALPDLVRSGAAPVGWATPRALAQPDGLGPGAGG
ncbi:hypothetical protein [Actinacidiphila oryziradicis]|uniref:hypothetical protein n=1 Tax=Actinacidiphila oryziradicis TaxID=2571141 RepID=UPI00145F5AC1|nr:hypothetical protein [Actinacidiphila oryziradicis]